MDLLEKEFVASSLDFQQTDVWNYFRMSKENCSQGWKIHISCQLKDSIPIFRIVCGIAKEYKCDFKVIKNLKGLKIINFPREMSPIANKFMTLYPSSDCQAKNMIIKLSEKLSYFRAPKILSDFQCGLHSPVHYRYGAFKKIQTYDEKRKQIVYMILDERNNSYVEDKRQNFPTLPNWKEDLFSAIEKEKYFSSINNTSDNSPIKKYNIKKILKRTNRGNVYFATKKYGGEKVIIKQARPYVNYDIDGKWTAIDELSNETFMLKKISNKIYTAEFIEDFKILDDYFMVQQYIDGLNFADFIQKTQNCFSIRETAIENLINLVNDIHGLGYKIVDMSPSNFIYSEKGDVTLIDLEMVSPVEKQTRSAKTPMMLNPDTDLTISSIQQDYFSLAVIGFSILTGDILSFSKKDEEVGLSALDKIYELIRIARNYNKLTIQQENWLYYLLKMSEEGKIDQIKKLEKFSNRPNLSISNFSFYMKQYNFKTEAENIYSYLLSQSQDKFGRIHQSNEFGEFISPMSFQHGMGGILFFINKFSKTKNDIVQKWLMELAKYNPDKFLHGYSLLFGEAGYLWAILDRYEETNEQYLYNISQSLVNKIIEKYHSVNEMDFALGKAGLMLTLLKYYSVFDENEIREFIIDNIEELISVLDVDNFKNIYEVSFAHGYSGIAYVLKVYADLFENSKYKIQLKEFSDKVVSLIEETLVRITTLDNLSLSWCEGISGLILYFCLVDKERYAGVIYNLQIEVLRQYEHMGTSFCHGLSSLLQTAVYNNNLEVIQLIKRIMLTRSFRDNNSMLLFQGEDGINSYLDFGIGNLGIYWTLLNYRFPFEIRK